MATAPAILPETEVKQSGKVIPFPTVTNLPDAASAAKDSFPTDIWSVVVTGRLKEVQRIDTLESSVVSQTFQIPLPKNTLEDQIMVFVFDSIRQIGGLTTKNENGTYSFYAFELFNCFTAKANIVGVTAETVDITPASAPPVS